MCEIGATFIKFYDYFTFYWIEISRIKKKLVTLAVIWAYVNNIRSGSVPLIYLSFLLFYLKEYLFSWPFSFWLDYGEAINSRLIVVLIIKMWKKPSQFIFRLAFYPLISNYKNIVRIKVFIDYINTRSSSVILNTVITRWIIYFFGSHYKRFLE